MRFVAAILCRAFGHKPYTHPHVKWERSQTWSGHDGTPVIVTRCSRCHVKLGERPMLSEDEPPYAA